MPVVTYPVIARFVFIKQYSDHPVFEVFSQVYSGIYRPAIMLIDLTLFCYIVYAIASNAADQKKTLNNFEDLILEEKDRLNSDLFSSKT